MGSALKIMAYDIGIQYGPMGVCALFLSSSPRAKCACHVLSSLFSFLLSNMRHVLYAHARIYSNSAQAYPRVLNALWATAPQHHPELCCPDRALRARVTVHPSREAPAIQARSATVVTTRRHS